MRWLIKAICFLIALTRLYEKYIKQTPQIILQKTKHLIAIKTVVKLDRSNWSEKTGITTENLDEKQLMILSNLLWCGDNKFQALKSG